MENFDRVIICILFGCLVISGCDRFDQHTSKEDKAGPVEIGQVWNYTHPDPFKGYTAIYKVISISNDHVLYSVSFSDSPGTSLTNSSSLYMFTLESRRVQ